MQVYMEAADEEGDENGRIDFPEFLAVMAKVIGQMIISLKIKGISTKRKMWTDFLILMKFGEIIGVFSCIMASEEGGR